MKICGIKLTHDGGVAVIEDGRVLFSTEIEKLNNNHRYSGVKDLKQIDAILAMEGIDPDSIDRFVLDGWHGAGLHWKGTPVLEVSDDGALRSLEVAPYNEQNLKDDLLQAFHFPGGLRIGGKERDYYSYFHIAGHVMGAYCSSPFAAAGESAFVLVWDGGVYPRLYYFDAANGRVENYGHLFFFLGTAYSIIGHYFGPYKKTEAELVADREAMTIEGYFGGYSIAGKIMSYIALGTPSESLVQEMGRLYKENLEISNLFEHKFCRAVAAHVAGSDFSDADVLASFHVFLQRMLLKELEKKLNKLPGKARNLCFSGGCALNIKWNSAIRASGLVDAFYVPPFPNDAGSALGTACVAHFLAGGGAAVSWSVFGGPEIEQGTVPDGWTASPCNLDALAALLHRENEPVVFLTGRAELGPRALGNRSILAPAVSVAMRGILNWAKKREDFRPVAPICIEEAAPEIFDPGTHDPFMLFDHLVRPEWRERVPAICHLDQTARLQTVSRSENAAVYALLQAYQAVSGIPLLCNTSANYNGSGFFPDVQSACDWGRVNYVWSEGFLFEKVLKVEEVRVQQAQTI